MKKNNTSSKFFIILSMIMLVFLFVKIKPNKKNVMILETEEAPDIHVLILEEVNTLSISIPSEFSILNKNKEVILIGTSKLKKGKIRFDKNGFVLESPSLKMSDPLGVDELYIQMGKANQLFQCNKKMYPGFLHLYKGKKGRFNVVNIVDLEVYLQGVLPMESRPEFLIEALKAQAVVSRAYAYFAMKENWGNKWHVKNTTRSQVYGGSVKVPQKFKLAVHSTRGLFLTDDNSVFSSYFSSSCGGASADVTSLPWEKEPLAVMKARSCSFCKSVKPKNFNWKCQYTLKEIEKGLLKASKKLPKEDFAIKDLRDVKIKDKDEFGRPIHFLLIGRKEKKEISAQRLRVSVLETSKMRSTFCNIKTKNGIVYFSGKGWGHGVGLCQFGSQGMAIHNFGYQAILKHYYPGVRFSQYY